MSRQDCEQLTLFQAGSRASRSVQPGSEEARRMTVTSGLKCCALLKDSGPVGSLVKTLLESSVWNSTRCLLIWKTLNTRQGRLLFQLVPLMPATGGKGAPLWPTPTAGSLCGGSGHYMRLKALEEAGEITEEERKSMSAGNGGQLNPDWVEWLMGFPIGWTSL